jgi:hypothetical protein
LTERGLNLSGEELGIAEGILSGAESSISLIRQIGYENVDKIRFIVGDAFLSGTKSGFLLASLLAVLGFIVVVIYVGRKIGSKN